MVLEARWPRGLQLGRGLRLLTKPWVPTCVSWDSPSCNVRSSRRSCSTCRWAPARHRSTPWSQRSSPAAEHSVISFSRRPRPSAPQLTYHLRAGDGVEGRSKQLPPVYKGLHDEVCHCEKSVGERTDEVTDVTQSNRRPSCAGGHTEGHNSLLRDTPAPRL